jgi:hypothetical protein
MRMPSYDFVVGIAINRNGENGGDCNHYCLRKKAGNAILVKEKWQKNAFICYRENGGQCNSWSREHDKRNHRVKENGGEMQKYTV